MIDSILIKPAGPDCNLDCEYCFYKCKSLLFDDSKHRMSTSLLETTIDAFLSVCKPKSTICFQGGEPTLMGLDFFRHAATYIKQKNLRDKQISFALQTNGVLLDEEFCKFLSAENWLVGLSIDGDKSTHDRYRKNYGASGSFSRVYNGMSLLKKHKVDFNTLTVITRENVGDAKGLFNFMRTHGSGFMQFIPCYEIDDGGVAQFCASPQQFGTFLCDMFDLWYNGGRVETYVRLFDELLISYVSLAACGCNQAPQCMAALVVEHTGEVYPCDFFVDPEWKLGDIETHPFADMLNSDKYHSFKYSKADPTSECRSCRFRCLCHGDCKKNRTDSGLSYFCESYKMLFKHCHEPMLRLKSEILAQKTPQTEYFRRLNQSVSRNYKCPCGSGDKYKKCCQPVKDLSNLSISTRR